MAKKKLAVTIAIEQLLSQTPDATAKEAIPALRALGHEVKPQTFSNVKRSYKLSLESTPHERFLAKKNAAPSPDGTAPSGPTSLPTSLPTVSVQTRETERASQVSDALVKSQDKHLPTLTPSQVLDEVRKLAVNVGGLDELARYVESLAALRKT